MKITKNLFLKTATVLAGLLIKSAAAGTLTLTYATNVISEAAGPGATTVMIKLDAPLTNNLLLLQRGVADGTKIFLPSGFPSSIPAGSTNVSFPIDSVNNGDIDGDKTVTLTVGADGFANASGSLLVKDDDTVAHRTIGGRLTGTVAGTNDYYVVDNLTIQPSTTLTILPASHLLFPANLGVTCNGSLVANGIKGAEIFFTQSAANVSWNGINIANNNAQTILNHVDVSHVGGNGLNVTPPGSLNTLILSNSAVHNCTGSGVAVTSWDSITVTAQTVQIVSNSIYANNGSGVLLTSLASQCNSSYNGPTITGNEIYNNLGSGVFLDASVYYNGCSVTCYTTVGGSIQGNFIHGNNEGITCLADTGSGSGANHIRQLNPLIRNNLIVNNSQNGIAIAGGVQRSLIPTIINNTIAGNGKAGIYHVTAQINFTIQNNLLMLNNYGIQASTTFSGLGALVVNNDAWGNYINNWLNYPAAYGAMVTNNLNGTGADTNMNISADPLVMNSGVDFHLQAVSPVIDAGKTNNAPATDIAGQSRKNYPDIGCYEFGSLVLATGAVTGNGPFTFSVTGGRGTTYTVDYTTDLKTWTSLTNVITLTNRSCWLQMPMTNAKAFYRLRIQ